MQSLLSPSIGVSQLWTKRNDHAPKSECADYFNICPKKGSFEKLKFDHSFVFYYFHLLFFQKKSLKIYYSNILCHGPLVFFYHSTSFASHHKTHWTMSINNVGLKSCFFGTSNLMITMTFFFLGVNQSGPKTNSIANHKYYMTLRQLHGPWCKQPLINPLTNSP